MAVQRIPAGYHTLTPYLIVDRAADAIDFYKRAFNAEEVFRMPGPAGKVMHAELQIGDSRFMLADEFPQMDALSPKTIGGTPCGFMIYVNDVDSSFAQAIGAGGTELRPVKDQFYGDRSGTLRDPFGHKWTVASHIEDVTKEEMERRLGAMKGPGAAAAGCDQK